MRISIAHLRAAGLTDTQIVKVIEEADAERREKVRIIKRKQRARPLDRVDTQDTVDSHIDTSSRDLERKRSKKVSISPDWKPTDADRKYARAKGWSDARIDTEAERFRIHYLANTKAWADWHLVWCKWVISSFQNGTGAASHGPAGPKRDERHSIRSALDRLDDLIDGRDEAGEVPREADFRLLSGGRR